MTLTPRQAAIAGLACLLLLAGSFGAGRFTAPSEVRLVESTVGLTTWDWRQDTREVVTQAPVRRTTRTVTRPSSPQPAGCPACEPVVEVTTTEDVGQVVTQRDTGTVAGGTSVVETRREETTKRDYPRLTLFGGVGSPVTTPQLAWTAGGLYRIEGPLGLGVQYLSVNQTVLVLASVTF